jgi:hypothetical protein
VAWNVGGDALLPSFVSLRYRDTVGFFPDLIGWDCWIARKGIRELFKVIDLFIRRPGVSHHLFSLLLCVPHHTYVHTVSVCVCGINSLSFKGIVNGHDATVRAMRKSRNG